MIMKFSFCLSLFLFCVLAGNVHASTVTPKAAKKTSKQKDVSGLITQTHAYCGGARPTEEVLKRLQTPAPFPGKKIYIRCGNENTTKKKIIRTVTADSTGHFSIKLPPGTYCIIQEEQVKKLDPDHFLKKETAELKLKKNCLEKWWSTCYQTFEVKATDSHVPLNVNFHFPCFTEGIPCMQYSGPLPP
jgi:hypothetical protein